MSRHGFHHVFNPPNEDQEELDDLIGYGIYDWLSRGVAGYDKPLGTFFFNLEGSWIFGIEAGEIPNIGMLQTAISAVFQGAQLPFNQEGLRKIAQEVESTPAVLSPAKAADLSNSISGHYLEERVALANYLRNNPEAAMVSIDLEIDNVAPDPAQVVPEGQRNPKRGFLSKAFQSIFSNK